MAGGRGARLRRLLLRSLLISVGAVAVMAAFGFAVGGWAGAQGGAMWGLAGAALAVPGLLLGIALHAGEDISSQLDDEWSQRRWGNGPRE